MKKIKTKRIILFRFSIKIFNKDNKNTQREFFQIWEIDLYRLSDNNNNNIDQVITRYILIFYITSILIYR